MKWNIKAVLALLAAVAILGTVIPFAALGSDAGTDNLLTNAGFEEGATGWNVKGNTAVQTGDAHSGNKALLLSYPTAWGEALTRTVAVEANTDYTLSFWIKRVSGNGVWDIFVYNSSISGVLSYTGGNGWFSTTSTAWTQHTVSFNSGSNTSVFLKFCPESNTSGTFLLDDVSLAVKGTEPSQPDDPDQPDNPTVSPLENGDFEAGAEGWTAAGGTAIQTGDAHGGDKAMLLSHSSAWGEALTRTVSVKQNTDYTLSFWYKRVSGSGAWNLYVYDGNKSSVLSYTSGDVWFGNGLSVPGWTQHTVTFNSGSNASLFLKFCPESTNSGTLLLDDVTLTAKGEEPDEPDDPDNPEYLPLQNGDFEAGTDGWTVGGDSAIDTTDPHGGQNALLLSHSVAWGEAAGQQVAVEPNTDYVLTFWVKRVSGGGAWNVYALNPGTFGAMPLTSGQHWFGDMDKAWVKYAIEFNSDALTSVILKFCPESANAGTFLLDDVTLAPKEIVYGVVNGGFEEGTNGWSVKGDTAIDTTDPHGGKNALLMSHSSAYGEAALQVVTLEAETDYTLTFWVKRVSGGGTWNIFVLDADDPASVLPYTTGDAWFSDRATDWVQKTITFNSAGYNKVLLKFCPESAEAGTFLLDDVSITESGETPTPPPGPGTTDEPLALDSFSVLNNRPKQEENNLIANSGFESAGDAPWNVDTFLSENLTVVKDDAARDSKKTLYFNTTDVTEGEAQWHVFWVDIEPETDYVFSAWLKGAFLSEDNAARATIGVIDPDTQLFLEYRSAKSSTPQRQIVPPAWDNQWHLRSVSFNSGAKTKIGIALYGYGSQLWVDDIALFKNGDGTKYMDENLLGAVTYRYDIDQYACADEDSLTENIHMDEDSDFWQSGTGWRNGFLSFAENKYEYGTSMKYTASSDPRGVQYVKWVEVEPNTDYIFSADIKVLKDGEGALILLDGKKRGCVTFGYTPFSTFDYGEDWFMTAFKFNTDVFTTIGIGVMDGGGEALIDNARLFKAEDGTEVKDPFVQPPTTATTATTTTTGDVTTMQTTEPTDTTTAWTDVTTEWTEPTYTYPEFTYPTYTYPVYTYPVYTYPYYPEYTYPAYTDTTTAWNDTVTGWTDATTVWTDYYPDYTDSYYPTDYTDPVTLPSEYPTDVYYPTEVPTQPSTQATQPTDGADDTFSTVMLWIGIGVGAAVLLAGGGILVIMLIKKRKRAETTEE